MKKAPALIAAFITTLLVGVIMVAVGANALLNPNSVAAANTPGQVQTVTQPSTTDPAAQNSAAAQAQIQQLQQRVAEYQAREKQYQSQLDQAKQQLSQANTQIQQASSQISQYQGLLQQLARLGIINVTSSGQITVPGFRGGGGDD